MSAAARGMHAARTQHAAGVTSLRPYLVRV